jgi:nucleotide-binding universal stress UspA family protein
MYKHLLVPTDGSALSQRAARDAVRLAAAFGARITALFVAPPPTPVVYEDFIPASYMTTEDHKAAIAKAAAKFLGSIEREAAAAGVPFEGLQVTGEYPAEAIVETAKKSKCDLIVMASHGRHGVKALLLGSETAKVLSLGKTPVLVHR